MSLRDRVKESNTSIFSFLALAFEVRNIAHEDHFFTESATRHETLNEFYHGIIELTDKFTEAYIGKTNVKKQVDSTESVRKLLKFCETNRSLCENDTALLNIMDEIQGFCLKTLYLLNKK